ncbi:energy transducer TonB [Methylobacterium sp. E-046]|uniref:energy transducer TonB family protein n=1 Tax=Methylobacterium sp. E-046 TaxID=2836576 RepID=UPI001FBA8669|nr:energy transducer TonB [Methylobacterium sp. E-046]MCJ2103532.1 energy transducer TonB [Methylobacterium sp. E-046]
MPRALIHGSVVLALLLGTWNAPAQAGSERAMRRWLSDLVTRIDAGDRAARPSGSARPTGTVVVHVRITPDGAVQQVEVERSSGSPDLDRRALRAVQGVGRLPAPPSALLDLSGVADLSIPVELGR